MSRLSALVSAVAVTLVAVAACGTTGDAGPGSAGPGGTATTIDGCPPVPAVTEGAPVTAVDYIDWVRWHGVSYIAPLDGPGTAQAGDVGEELFRVACEYSELNERTGREPPGPVDRSAAFLRAGTPVHALRGWAPECRLTAELDGAWHVYVATVPGAPTLTVAPCATAPGGTSTS